MWRLFFRDSLNEKFQQDLQWAEGRKDGARTPQLLTPSQHARMRLKGIAAGMLCNLSCLAQLLTSKPVFLRGLLSTQVILPIHQQLFRQVPLSANGDLMLLCKLFTNICLLAWSSSIAQQICSCITKLAVLRTSCAWTQLCHLVLPLPPHFSTQNGIQTVLATLNVWHMCLQPLCYVFHHLPC